jgi:hypothetical protein
MKTENKKGKLGLLLLVILAGSFVVAYTHTKNNEKAKMAGDADQTFSLVKPVFAQSSSPTFLEDEAGMSIWVNIGASLNISQAKAAYKTIEKETPDYIIGSISLPSLPETEDPHCFIHKDGWIVVYYLKAEPISKIIDWNYYSDGNLAKTKLQIGLEEVGNALGVTVTDMKYYHFQYPDAEKLMIIIESVIAPGQDSFNIKIPSELTIYERSWSHIGTVWYGAFYTYKGYFKIDGITVNEIDKSGIAEYGQLTATQLSPDVFHTVTVGGPSEVVGRQCVAIVLAYKEP